MEVERRIKEEEVNEDEGEATLNQTGFLLARLKELREWQREQEEKLLTEQKEQMDKLKTNNGGGDGMEQAVVEGEEQQLAYIKK
jgi:hypothetical protein